jgi:hypothetical protein
MLCLPMAHPCSVEGCDRSAKSGRTICDGHRKQKQYGRPLTSLVPRKRTLRGALVDAAIALADVSTHDDSAFAARWDQLKMAALRYARAETTAGESSATPNEVAATDEATHRILIVRD